ncbi:DNA cytosine methyltransferase [Candidatus Methylospira mobilis]|uniref:DNA cytosine methyltransferase n=1 Tax=Candidatus Methylospira mobilis TaxID=1808979 RepID=A0A5Q0BLH3_9GAMM|nr:DNA cytosine methyltransferase [Candidatus Methylospira mobilis]QFY42968.1 DNA cytosine methyltransferase [Candidatus Methylospira mobilis]
MTAYYNEIDKNAAAWLRELIADGQIAPGDVDESSIEYVKPDDLVGYTQCHFFAGIGGWSYALRLAGWPDDRPVWTGSCPCQPFSAAGKRKGVADERHLWPAWFHLIEQRRPPVVFGEQVESAIKHGWLDLVQDDLEGIGYAVGAVGLPAASIGAAHIRQRLWFVANAESKRQYRITGMPESSGRPIVATGSDTGFMGYAASNNEQRYRFSGSSHRQQEQTGRPGASVGMVYPFCERLEGYRRDGDSSDESGRVDTEQGGSVTETGAVSPVADPNGGNTGTERQQCGGEQRQLPENRVPGVVGDSDRNGREARSEAATSARHGGSVDSASDWHWIECRDGKFRPIEPGVFPLVNGLPRGVVPSSDPSAPGYANATSEARMMRLKGYGNAIHPELAAEFIRAAS